MIYDSVENIGTYCDEDDAIAIAVNFVDNFDISQPDGRYEIHGDEVYAMVQTVKTTNANEKFFEAHNNYVDVQMVLEGEERQDVVLLDIDELEIEKDYDSEKDIMFFKAPEHFSTLIMKPDMFVVYGPDDAHRPCCCVNKPGTVRKVCVKIKIEGGCSCCED
ncbi:MAG TPA: YhcH/YjgK/YiaL family protein [Sedimentisphaerales bacterium]|nr:YhcH/YjgK/YiaL family protein [Sedimentisphaerales bacterium]